MRGTLLREFRVGQCDEVVSRKDAAGALMASKGHCNFTNVKVWPLSVDDGCDNLLR